MKKVLFIALTLNIGLLVLAQPGALDLTFDPGAGVNGNVQTSAIQTDGKIIIGGHFTLFDGVSRNRIARLHPDGSLDTTFHVGSGTNRGLYAIDIQADGKVIFGGKFNTYNGITANKIMRVNPDGSPDTTFNLNSGTGFDDHVRCISIQPDGKILVGGYFTLFNGTGCPHLVRLNPDGSRDSAFNMGSGPNNNVEDIAIQPDNKIVIVGDFTLYGGSGAGRILRLNTDGTRDTAFTNPAFLGAGSVIYDIEIQDGGKILIGGNFITYSLQSRRRIAQLHEDGVLDSSFDPVLGPNTDVVEVEILFPNNDGLPNRCMIGGDFHQYNSQPITRLAVLKTDGYLDTTFKPGTGPDSMVYHISQQSDGRVIIGGSFANYNGIARSGIARIYVCETMQPDLIIGPDSVLCAGATFVYSVPVDPVVDRYDWTLPQGWTGSSDSVSIIVTTNGQGGEISVVAFTDSCGYSTPQTKTIYRIQPPEVPICRVTVDEPSTHNVVVWKTPADLSLIDSFFVYRETTSGIFSKIASVDRNSVNYHDATANPNITSYRYKLSVLDICGVESALSPYHKTIHLQNLGNGNFHWTFYEIEGSSSQVVEYNIYRDNLGNGNFIQIGLVPGSNSTFTDVNYADFSNSSYLVDVNWNISCTAPLLNVNTTRSNIRRKVDTLVSVQDIILKLTPESILVYPNPAKDILLIQYDPSIKIRGLQLWNSLGQAMRVDEQVNTFSKHTSIIPVGTLQKGIYVLAIETDAGWLRKKVIIR